MIKILLAVLLGLPSFSVSAANFSSSANGTTAADFLNLGVGARAIGMGGAYTAVADDATAMYWNPAGLSQVTSKTATFMNAPYIQDSSLDYGAYAQNLGALGAFGVSVDYFSAGSIAQTQNYQNVGTFSPYDMAISLGYAYTFKDSGFLNGYSMGLAAKYIDSKILSAATAEAVDLGILSPDYDILGRPLKLAFTVSNLGTDMNFGSLAEPLPLTIKTGGSYKILENWLASLDLAFPRGGNPYFNVGTEYGIWKDAIWNFTGRAGYSSYTLNSIDGFTGPSFGVGLEYKEADVDYAFVPYGGLGQAHRISLSFKWGGGGASPQSSPSRSPSPTPTRAPSSQGNGEMLDYDQ